jgi:hypothetical protein
MNPRTKRILQIIGIVLVFFFFVYLIFALLFSGAPSITEISQEDDRESEEGFDGLSGSDTFTDRLFEDKDEEEIVLEVSDIADGGEATSVQLTSSAVTSPTLSSGSQITFYNPTDGGFYEIDSNGNITLLSSATFPEADTVVFSDTSNKVALEFPDGSNIVYDLETGKQTTLPSHWEDFEFSDDGEEFVSKSITGASTLVLTNSDGSQAVNIAELGPNASEVTLNWSPNNSIVAFSETGSAQSAFGRQEIYLIDDRGKAIGSIIVEGTNFSAIWAPSGNYILYSIAASSDKDRPALWFTNTNGDIGSSRTNLNLPTWVEKCTFQDETYVICGIPDEVPNFSGFDHRLVDSGDSIYRINISTGVTQLIADLTDELQIENLFVSDDASLLYFTDQFGILNRLRLR